MRGGQGREGGQEEGGEAHFRGCFGEWIGWWVFGLLGEVEFRKEESERERERERKVYVKGGIWKRYKSRNAGTGKWASLNIGSQTRES